jgi:hypothetical protein
MKQVQQIPSTIQTKTITRFFQFQLRKHDPYVLAGRYAKSLNYYRRCVFV